MDFDSYKLGQRIFAARMHCKMNQETFGSTIGVGQSSVSDIELGKAKLTVELLYKISEALDVSVLWLLGEIKNDYCLTDEEDLEIQKFIDFLINKRK